MKRFDLYLAAAVIAAALIIWFIMKAITADANTVVVSVDGERYMEYSLDSEVDITIPGADGGFNRLVIKDGKADIVDADCPDKLCVHQSPVSLGGEALVCLPHKVIVSVEGEKGAPYDAAAD